MILFLHQIHQIKSTGWVESPIIVIKNIKKVFISLISYHISILMVDAETGKYLLVIGMAIGIAGVFIFILAFVTSAGFIWFVGFFMAYGAGFVCVLGLIIYYAVGDKYKLCQTCGAEFRDNIYICPKCNTKSPDYYHQKFSCYYCGKRTRFYDYGGRCKYCGNLLPRV